MKRTVFILLFFISCLAGASAQTFTFECYGGYLTGADCQICTGTTTARLFNGLIIRKGTAVYKLIDCPYYVRQQGNNLLITELIPNPESVTISLLSSGYSTITGFRDSVACMCARQDSSWIGGGGGDTAAYYQTFKRDGSAAAQQEVANFVTSPDIDWTLTNDGANNETEIQADIKANAVQYAEMQQVSANRLLGNPTGSTANVVEIPLATGLFFAGGNLNVADRDSLNELQTFSNTSNTTSHTLTLSQSGGSIQLVEGTAVGLATSGSSGAGIVTISVDTSIVATVTDAITNLTYTGTSSPVTLNSSTGTDVTITAGAGVGLTGTTTNLTITNTAPDQTVSIAGAGINVVTGTYPNFTITGTEVDGLTNNEGSLTVGAGGANTSTINSNTAGSTNVTVSGSTTVLVTETGSTITIQADTSVLATVNDIRDCRWCSVKQAMPYYSNNPNTAFEALRTYWGARMGEIVIDTTVTLSANTTVNASVRFVGGGNINVTTGNTLTFSSTVSADPKHHIFTGAGDYDFNAKSTPVLWVYWYGALGNDSADDTDEIQKCIDDAIESKVTVVRFLSGYHRISKGILIRNGTTFATLTVEGRATYSDDAGTVLKCTHNDNFAIGIQGAREVVISDLYVMGSGSSYNPTVAQVITNTKSAWAAQYGRDDRYSPFAGIVIDPFKNGAPSGGGYPGFSAQYSATQALSASVHLQRVVSRYFIAGVMISPSGQNGNGSEVFIDKCIIDRCEYGIATANTQSRTVDVTGCMITSTAACLDGLTFGGQASPMPNVIGGQFGSCKDILNYQATQGDMKISSIYAESVYRIGKITGNSGSPLNLTNCEIKFITSSETSLPDAASVLDAVNINMNVTGGSLIYSTSRPVEMNVRYLVLKGVFLNRPILNNPSGNSRESRISYEGCQISGYGSQFASSLVTPVVDGVDYQRAVGAYLVPGQKVAYYEAGTSFRNAAVFTATNDAEDHTVVIEASVSVTVDTTARTATFTGTNVDRYRVGDILFAYNNLSSATPGATSKACSFGIVTDISGSTITCGHIPAGIASGTLSVYLWKETIFTGTFLANITSGSNKCVIVSKNNSGPSLATVWPVGTRVYAKSNQSYSSGLYTGLYVSSVTADTLFLSGNVGSTVSNLEIFSADLRVTYYSEDNTYQTSASTYRTVGYQTGDEILFSSHAYRARAVVTAGGFTPTVKFIFKPLVGVSGSKPSPATEDAGLTYLSTDTDRLEIWDGSAWNAQDGSITNELQTLSNTSDATSHTVTLSNSGGSFKIAEGSGITITTTGTGLDGIATIAAVSGGITGSGANTQMAYFTGTSTIAGSNNLLYASSIFQVKNNSTSTNFGATTANENIRVQNTDATANNYSGLSFYTQGGSIAGGIGGKYINHTTGEFALELYGRNSSGSFQRIASFANPTVTFDKAVTMTLATTFSGGFTSNTVAPTFNAGFTVNTVAPTFNTNLQLGSSSIGSQLKVYNDYALTSSAGSSAYAAILLTNRNNTTNNRTAIQWDASGGSIAGAIDVQFTNHASSYGTLNFYTRGSATSYGLVAQMTDEKELLVGGASAGARVASRGKGTSSATYSGIFETSSGTDVLTIRDDSRVGVLTASPNRALEVAGEVRITDLATDTPTKIVGADGDGDLDTVGIGAENELHITGGTLGTNFHTTITPAQITSNQTTYNPTGAATAWIWRISADDGFRIIRSITAPAFNKLLTLVNAGSNAILLTNEDNFVSVTAANRFSFGRDVVLFPGKTVQIQYDVTSSRWRLVSKVIYDDVEHLYFNERLNAPISGNNGDYSFWEFQSENTVGGIAPVAGRMSGLSVNTGSSASGLGYVASKDVFFENTNVAGTANWAYFKAVIKTPANLSDGTNDYTLRIGFADATGGGGANDGAYFDYNHSNVSGNWGCNTTNAGSTQRNNSGVAVTTSTTYVLEVVSRPDLTVEFYINGTRVATNDTFVPSGTSDDLLVMSEIQKSIGTAQRDLTVYTLQTSIAFVK